MEPKNNRKINIIKSNQRKTWTKQNKNLEIKKKKKKKKRKKIWILNATSMLKPWHLEFIKKALH